MVNEKGHAVLIKTRREMWAGLSNAPFPEEEEKSEGNGDQEQKPAPQEPPIEAPKKSGNGGGPARRNIGKHPETEEADA